MSLPIPGGSEPGYLAFVIVDNLMDLLVKKGTISAGERAALLNAVIQRCEKEGGLLGQRCGEFLRNGILP